MLQYVATNPQVNRKATYAVSVVGDAGRLAPRAKLTPPVNIRISVASQPGSLRTYREPSRKARTTKTVPSLSRGNEGHQDRARRRSHMRTMRHGYKDREIDALRSRSWQVTIPALVIVVVLLLAARYGSCRY
jgi:hypothetical protein